MITIFQHGRDEPAGAVANILAEQRIPFSTIGLFNGDVVPDDLPDGLIVLGGEMSVNDTQEFPFLADEKAVIRRMVASERPVLGICLGAQLIASSFGQQVFRDTREQGWISIWGCKKAAVNIFPETFRVFHWHNETFALPGGAELLAYGKDVPNQAFRLGSAVGVQYHPEVTPAIIARWSSVCSADERVKIFRESELYITQGRQHCQALVGHFLRSMRP